MRSLNERNVTEIVTFKSARETYSAGMADCAVDGAC